MRFRTIAVPLDGSPFAEHALPVAAALARAARARLRLMLVHRLPSPPKDRDGARLYVSIELAVRRSERDYLRAVAGRLRERFGVQVTTLMLDGKPGPALTRWIDETGPDVVVMTTRGRGGVGRALLGSVADHLVRSVEVPVILVRPTADEAPAPDAAWRPDEIVVPLDGSRLAEAALAPAAEIARLLGAPLTLVQVIQPMLTATDPPLSFPLNYDETITEIRRREAGDYLEDIAGGLRDAGLTATPLTVLGASAAGTLLDLGRGDRSRLVAIATRGRGGASRALLGSVADKLVRAAESPVLVIRPRGR